MNLMQMFLDASDDSAGSKVDREVRLDAPSTRNIIDQLTPEQSRNASNLHLILPGEKVRTAMG